MNFNNIYVIFVILVKIQKNNHYHYHNMFSIVIYITLHILKQG